jgi:predicted transcriptional regulator
LVSITNLYNVEFDTFFMVSYRTSMQIVGDLLTVTKESGQDGIKTNALISKANLPHSRLSKLVSNLIGSGLITKIEFDGKHTFVITQKGRQYLESYRRFSTIAESFGLEL